MDEELKGLLVAIGGKLDSMDRKIDALSVSMGVAHQDISHLVTGHAVLLARLDEQRATINALIPTRLAAVPPSAAE
jgi:hypothetical protein